MLEPNRSDRSLRRPVNTRDLITLRRRQNSESGQATTEFALLLLPLLLIVVGIIQFGIALNFWLDEQRIANQGARWAIVNAWPGCANTAPANSCTATPACTSAPTNTTLANYLKCQAISQGLRDSVKVSICYPDDGDASNNGRVGSPVRVSVDTPFSFVPIMELGTITLTARATMRLEQNTDPSVPAPSVGHLSGVGACT
jgi:Flp pilus assembly protein TadG